MKVKEYQYFKAGLLVLVGLVMGLAIYTKSVLLVLLGLGSGMVLTGLIKARVKGVIEDERIVSIHEKAARAAFGVLMPILGLTSLSLVVGGRENHYYLQTLGIIFSYITMLSLVIYLAAYLYYSKKH